MSFTFKLLKKSDSEVILYYDKANEIWDRIFLDYDGDSSKLAKTLSDEQLSFEWIFEGSDKYHRWDRQELMVLSGLSYFLYGEDKSKTQLADTVAEAFEMSFCSIEVKWLSKKVANLFSLGGKSYD